MKTSPSALPRGFLATAFLSAALAGTALRAAEGPAMVAKPAGNTAVTVADNGRAWTLDNGIVKAVIDKHNGAMNSLFYKGIDTMGHEQGQSGYWEQDPSAAAASGGLTDSLTIDPAKNGGERVEVSVKGVTGGQTQLSSGAPGGGTYCDMEVRYTMGRGESGVYVYAIFTHPASYRAGGVGSESRYITKINQTFNWISVDADRNMLQCSPTDWGTGVVVHAKEQRILSVGPYKNSVEHKYSYSGVQYQTSAYGWSSTKDHIGIWFINPTIEYLSGGPTKLELDCHFGDNDNPDPIILDYWEGGHYDTGATCRVAAGETWNKVIGPIFVYVNSLANPKTPSPADMAAFASTAGNPTIPPAWTENQTALFQDALAQAKKETAKWPYDWVNGVDYPHKDQRGTVTGQIVLNDPLAPTPSTKLPNLRVGLAHPDAGGVIWIHDAKYYQFWNDGGEDGKFTIPNVRPGNYTLHAFADGVLGDFTQANITVQAGKSLDLGKLDWKPARYGRQLWDIGYPDRTGGKFFKGDGANYWLWGWNLRYALLFPNDITYTIGKSDYHKDWFFEEVPHATNFSFVNPAAKDPANQRFGWVKAESLTQYPQSNTRGPWNIYGRGRATTWTIKFNLDKPAQGQAALRVALAGVNAITQLPVTVNGRSVGAIGGGGSADNARLITTNTIRYNSDKGLWQERTLRFDAAMLKPGENEMTFTVAGGDLQSGVVWDYLRLELAGN
ncbi:MAG: polysaccharide lyase family protein [Verrucomicrobiota bacterium]|jgi:rhamnogalacturonan endolyase